jgi:hypothetical protein
MYAAKFQRSGALLLAGLLLLIPVQARALETGGFIKGAFFNLGRSDGTDDSAFVILRTRLDVREDIGIFHGEISPEARFILSSEPSASPVAGPSFGGRIQRSFLNLSHTFINDSQRRGEVTLDRLFGSLTFGQVQLAAGRQAVGFGTSLFWAPTDLLSPFSPEELDREVRTGTDALRLIWSPSRLSEAGLVFAPGRGLEDNSTLAHARFQMGSSEAFLIGGLVRERKVLGGSLTGEARGMGLRIEGIVLESKNREAGGIERSWDVETIGGFDYRFDGGLYLAAEYLYSGAGSSRPAGYPALTAREPFTLGLVPFLGRHYLLARLSKQLHPLVNGSLSAYVNLSDTSLLAWPEVSVSLADNLQATAFLFIPAGPGDTEYGRAAVTLGCWLTWTF